MVWPELRRRGIPRARQVDVVRQGRARKPCCWTSDRGPSAARSRPPVLRANPRRRSRTHGWSAFRWRRRYRHSVPLRSASKAAPVARWRWLGRQERTVALGGAWWKKATVEGPVSQVTEVGRIRTTAAWVVTRTGGDRSTHHTRRRLERPFTEPSASAPISG